MNSNKKIVISSIFGKYTKSLVELQREYISVEANPLDNDLLQDPLDLKQSKFLGNPFIPIDD